MKIERLRLLGFKSFVEPTELIIEPGLTGVLGPNGCGKSNLLEALRWVMGETSYKSMRGSSMEDVIFSGTDNRPKRNMAEVTMFLDNSERKAPAEFNDSDSIEVTRRIEREMGSAYRINGKEARARDIKLLFEDAATGARSPALVRQGQIGEIVNAKPEQRRRILEDAAGIAGLHSRRHEAELRLRQASGNMERLLDVQGQLNSQLESMKRQARQARRYKELSTAIRQAEALALHLVWLDVIGKVDRQEAALAQALVDLGQATRTEAAILRAEQEASEALQPLRNEEATRSALLHRAKVAQETFEQEALRTHERLEELAAQSTQLQRDLERESAMIAETAETQAKLTQEQEELTQADHLSLDISQEAHEQLAQLEDNLQEAETRLSEANQQIARTQAQRTALDQAKTERQLQIEQFERQLATLNDQVASLSANAPDKSALATIKAAGQRLVQQIAQIETQTVEAEELVRCGASDVEHHRQASIDATRAADRLATEVKTLQNLLQPDASTDFPPIVDQLRVDPGFEQALGAALGDDLEASTQPEAPLRWASLDSSNGAGITLSDAPLSGASTSRAAPCLPADMPILIHHVTGPAQLTSRLSQIGVVSRDAGPALHAQLQPGQRLVSREGDLWRWDGFCAAADAPNAAARRLTERNRLTDLAVQMERAQAEAEQMQAIAQEAIDGHRQAQETEQELRQSWRDRQTQLTHSREEITRAETAARETATRLENLQDAIERVTDSLAETHEKLMTATQQISALPQDNCTLADRDKLLSEVQQLRATHSESRAAQASLEREGQMRQQRLSTIMADLERWTKRSASADQQIATLNKRLAKTRQELEDLTDLPAKIASGRQQLLNDLSQAEAERKSAADALVAAETALQNSKDALRDAQASVAQSREHRARIEVKLESARERRTDHAAKIASQLDCAPDGCLAIAEREADEDLPPVADIEHKLTKLKADRERMGGVNLTADAELERLTDEHQLMETERLDLEQAIAKLHGAIAKLNKEARGRLLAAFETVNNYFKQLFSTLFEGGEARLELIEDDDPLHSGLEIIARPPGKKPATLSLLSGGEQTLTALSLIFAVFLTNPSPICVLDEVDAPLDDANVDRFCAMMERMATDTDTRFLVITHHPMTMARMDRLFGVTMGEKGVSQLVSVDLVTAERIVDAA